MTTSTARILAPQEPYERDPALLEAAALLRAGELVAFPTETVYGLGADATNPAAIERVYAVKGRPPDNPLIVHVGHNADLPTIAEVGDPRVVACFKRFWPGALTMVLPALEPYRTIIGRGLETIAVRMPGHPIALALIHAAGVPLAAPSANLSGRPSPTTAQHVAADLGERIPLILDGGPCLVGIESTVLDLTVTPARILRPGIISAAMISQVLGAPVKSPGETATGSIRSPGVRHPHYQPSVPVLLLPSSTGGAEVVRQLRLLAASGVRQAGLILRQDIPALQLDEMKIEVRIARHAEALTRGLYGWLRELEGLGAEAIVVEGVEATEPVMDRLRRAAQQKPQQ